jgi:hypothetical protein
MYQKIHRWVDEDEVAPSEPDAAPPVTRDPDNCELAELPEPKRREAPTDDY